VLQSLPVDEFHHDKGPAILFPDVIDRANVRMTQRRGGFGFAAESFESRSVVRGVVRQKFESDPAVKADVLRLVNHAHATAAQLLGDAIVRDSATCQGQRIGHAVSILGSATRQVNGLGAGAACVATVLN
jgi:hypothetical protein